MIKIVYTHNWWSIGENLGSINQVLTFISFFRKLFPNKFYFVLNFWDGEFIVENCINVEQIKHIPDEFCFLSEEYSHESLLKKGFIKIDPQNQYIFVEEKNLKEINQLDFYYENKKYVGVLEALNIFYMELHSHPLNKIRHYVPVLDNDSFIPHNKGHNCLVDLNQNIYKKSQEIINQYGFSDFDCVMFKWEQKFNSINMDKEIEDYVDLIIPFLNKDRRYFLSSNNSLFYTKFKKKFDNCFFIKRGKFDLHFDKSQEEIPNIIDFDSSKIRPLIVSNYIAHIELAIICQSKKIFYTNDFIRPMISLFLWLPILKYSIPISWIYYPESLLIERVYNFESCLSQTTTKYK